MKLFKPEQFKEVGLIKLWIESKEFGAEVPKRISEITNAILAAYIESLPTMTVSKLKRDFDVRYDALPDNFKCRLIDLKTIEKETK